MSTDEELISAVKVTLIEKANLEKRVKELEEGKTKWHDLRKDPNDLPKLEDKRFSWSITVATNQIGEACHYNYKRSRWETTLFTEIKGVIAWCELPKFEG